MTTDPGELERKVRQMDNDVQSVYELLASISAQQARHLNRLGALDAKIDNLGVQLSARMDGLDSKLDRVIDALGQG